MKPSSRTVPETTAPAQGATAEEHVINRAFLSSGAIAAALAREHPELRLLTDEERRASLQAALAARPEGAAWLFGYGSLIWNPIVHHLERRVARISGWHRAFCLTVRAGRGSRDNPGLVLGLDAGGECTGVAYRIDEDLLQEEFELLWRREMVAGSYIPRWVDLLDDAGARFGSALAFTIDPCCAQYAGCIGETEVVQRLATASGLLGSSADYLFRTCASLRDSGLPDADLERLEARVKAYPASCG